MKKASLIVLATLFVLIFVGCARPGRGTLTLENVKQLAQKGEALSWSDFSQYGGTDVGSGLVIMAYPVFDADFEVYVGGTGTAAPPLYIYLVASGAGDSAAEKIDIRYEDVEAFIARFS